MFHEVEMGGGIADGRKQWEGEMEAAKLQGTSVEQSEGVLGSAVGRESWGVSAGLILHHLSWTL